MTSMITMIFLSTTMSHATAMVESCPQKNTAEKRIGKKLVEITGAEKIEMTIDSIVPVTVFKTSHTGVLATGTPGIGRIQSEVWSNTVYPQGSSVTKIVHYAVSIYDNHASLKEYNQPNKIDIRA
jgi:hypothetical protein